jgi:predicted MFS family arabinose efflux permease
MGAIGVPIMGAIGDAIGLQGAYRVLAVVASASIVLSLLLPTERQLEQLTTQKEGSPA